MEASLAVLDSDDRALDATDTDEKRARQAGAASTRKGRDD